MTEETYTSMESEEVVTLTESVGEELYNSSPLSIELVSTAAEFEALSDAWNTLAEAAVVHIFQTFEWQYTWWKHFGGSNQLHILCFRKDGQLVGIAPFFLDIFRILGRPVYRALRLIGSSVMQPQGGGFYLQLAFSDYLSLITLPEYEEKVMHSLEIYIRMQRKLFDEIILDEIPENDPLISYLIPLLDEHQWNYTMRDDSVCPVIDLPTSWDDLLKDLSSNARYQIRRHIRNATQKEMFQIEEARTREEVERAYEHLVEFHQRRWNKVGYPGVFADKRVHDFLEDGIYQLRSEDRLLVQSVKADGAYVAVDVLFRHRDSIYLIQRGFDDESPVIKRSPGNALLYTVIKDAIDKGYQCYEFLRGEEEYKSRTATRFVTNKNVILRHQASGKRFPSQVLALLHWYTSLKTRLVLERKILSIQLEQHNFISAIGAYLRFLYQRIVEKMRKLWKRP
ncbi:MAG TPA: GNAT family N-acetyltransferase [bacterium]|nr:GNAT family N-acetyltransferase [bacterium]